MYVGKQYDILESVSYLLHVALQSSPQGRNKTRQGPPPYSCCPKAVVKSERIVSWFSQVVHAYLVNLIPI